MDTKLIDKYKAIYKKYEDAFLADFVSMDNLNSDYIFSIIKIIEFWADENSINLAEDESPLRFEIKEESYIEHKIINRRKTEVEQIFPINDASLSCFHSSDFHGDLNALMYFLLKSDVVKFKKNENQIIFYDLKKNKIIDLDEILLTSKENIRYCFPIPNIEINYLFSSILTLGGDFIDRGKFSIPTILIVLYILNLNKNLSQPKNINACIGNHEYDLIQSGDKLDDISKLIALNLKKAIENDIFKFCYPIRSNLIVSHSVIVGDLEKIFNILEYNEVKLFFPSIELGTTIKDFLCFEATRSFFDLINYGFKKIISSKIQIPLCDVCIYDIKQECPWLIEFGIDKLKFRNIIGHQIDNQENVFRIPISFDGARCCNKFLITDACQCVSERENVARDANITPARFLHISSNFLKCEGANISNQMVLLIGYENLKKQFIKSDFYIEK